MSLSFWYTVEMGMVGGSKSPCNTESELLVICHLTGLFMASRANIIACGTRMAVLAMAVKFIAGPALMAVSSIAVGLRGTSFRVAIMQVQTYTFCILQSTLRKYKTNNVLHHVGSSSSRNRSVCVCKRV